MSNRSAAFLPIGIGVGLAIGVVFGKAVDNLALGLSLGVAVGAGLGVALMGVGHLKALGRFPHGVGRWCVDIEQEPLRAHRGLRRV